MELLNLTEFDENQTQVFLKCHAETFQLTNDLNQFLSNNGSKRRLGKCPASDSLSRLKELYKNLIECLPVFGALFKNPKNDNDSKFVPITLKYSKHRFNPIWMLFNEFKIQETAKQIKLDLKANHTCDVLEMVLPGINIDNTPIKKLVSNFRNLRETIVWSKHIVGGGFILSYQRSSNRSIVCQIHLIVGTTSVDTGSYNDLIHSIKKKWNKICDSIYSELKCDSGIEISAEKTMSVYKTLKGKWDILLINRILKERGMIPEQWQLFGCLSYSSGIYGKKYTIL